MCKKGIKKKVRINFCDTYPSFDIETSVITRAIRRNFEMELCDDPDYLIVLPYGHNHLKYSCVKILCTGENFTPDFNLFDYAAGFDYLEFGDRYIRTPLWALRDNFRDFRMRSRPSDQALLGRKFCSMVVSNEGGDPIRKKFFLELSKYKQVDSGGRFLNNVGGPVLDKMSFLANYKFNIAFENSSYPGYTTEKIMDSFSVWSVPLYWGDPLVGRDFLENSFIRIRYEDDIERSIAEIVQLDRDDEAYLRRCVSPCLVNPDLMVYENKLAEFFVHIFNQPIERARRVANAGYAADFYRRGLMHAFETDDVFGRLINIKRKLFK